MTAEEITKYLNELNDELRLMNIKGEVSLFGGAVMVLAFNARAATKDVDAIFRPAEEIRKAAAVIAARHGMRDSWLNDGVKGYWASHDEKILFSLPFLTVFIPEPDYMLAMKAIAARAGTDDINDARLLIKLIGLHSPEEVFSIVENYYPRHQIPPRTAYFIEGLFEK